MNAKKIIIIAGTAILIYSLIIYPVQLANGVQATVGGLMGGVESVLTFMRYVFA